MKHLDKCGVERAAVMSITSTSLKQLFDQSRFLLLQLSDAIAFLTHLLQKQKN